VAGGRRLGRHTSAELAAAVEAAVAEAQDAAAADLDEQMTDLLVCLGQVGAPLLLRS
jgi:hypothetical protein